jgi:thiol-disulfide isomerase/thioredoxin
MKSFPILFTAALALGLFHFAAFSQSPGPLAQAPNPADLSQYNTADSLWLHIQDVEKGSKTRPTTMQQYQQGLMDIARQLAAGTAEFLSRYPEDPRKWDARFLQIVATTGLNELSGHPDEAGYAAQLRQLAADPGAPSEIRAQADSRLLGMSLRSYLQKDPSISADSVVAQLRQFITNYPTFPNLDALKYQVALVLYRSDSGATDTLLTELANSGEGAVADQARRELTARARLKNRLDLHFTATDGSDVDLTKMRGKVVLVDFWATWCPESCADFPYLLQVYQKLHDKGFEVVCISLDQNRNALDGFTFSNNIAWPQYFDGKKWQNDIAAGYAVHWIPTVWLVNKQGYVVSTHALENLGPEVEKLLAEK